MRVLIRTRLDNAVSLLQQAAPRAWTRPVLGVAVALALSLASVTASVAANASTVADAAAVGEVSMVLGKAYLRGADGSKELLKRGSLIGVSDTIETASNGHVHVRFVDQALVVVRPSSTLEIERYEYNAQDPANSAVKFNLLDGVARSISGDAAQSAKQNFRLNTPIAAIGVRGTDFVVSASQQSVRALVKEGSIVLAPFSSDCMAAALGPCSVNATELAGDAGQIAVLDANSLQAALLPRLDSEIPEALLQGSAQPLVADAGETEHEEDGGADIYADSVTSLAVNRKISDGRQLTQVPPTPPPPPPPPPVDITPDVALTTDELTRNTQLVWGRWFERRLPTERITVSYAEAAVPGREISVASDSYALFRSVENGVQDVNIKPGLGVIGFNLTQAQAILNTGSTRELMDVYGGLLNINFDERLFTTSLQLGHAATGNIEFTDAGRVFDGGTFRNRSDDKVTAGVLTIDGTEAGYFFQTTVNAGAIEGVTLWSVKP